MASLATVTLGRLVHESRHTVAMAIFIRPVFCVTAWRAATLDGTQAGYLSRTDMI
jgi:hypothetical protein